MNSVDSADRPTDGEKEQIELTSACVDGIAVGVVVVGGLFVPSGIISSAGGVGAIAAAGFILSGLFPGQRLHSPGGEGHAEGVGSMRDFLPSTVAVLWMPATALAVTYFVSRDTDRMIAKGRRETIERNVKSAR